MGHRFKDTTPFLFYCALMFAWGGIMFGLDTGSFGAIQALPSFLSRFGTKDPKGQYELTTTRTAIMNGVVWPGKLLGTMSFEPLAENFGFKKTMFFCCFAQLVGVLIEITAKEWIQFSVGRIVAYYTVGIVENVVPSYTSEIAPASLRGLFAGSLQCIVTLGNMWGAGMGAATANYTTAAGWLIPVGVQFIPAVILVVGVPFAVESPRWLISRGKKEDALNNLNRLRPKKLIEDGSTGAEVSAIDHAIQANDARDRQGSWLDLFRDTYLRRTIVAALLFWFQQSTGTQFVNSYGPTFFESIGYGASSFTYSFLTQVVGFIGALISCLVTDKIGRRPLLISGMILAALFNFLIAGMGTNPDQTKSESQTVIAALILLSLSCKYSTNMLAFLIAAEIGGVKMRKKTIAFGTTVDVLSAFIVTFSIPYILGPPGNFGAGLGWLLGGNSVLAVIFAIFFVPELKGRSLEEVDELFEAKLWAWQFHKYQTKGIGSRITHLEDSSPKGDKVNIHNVEEVDERRIVV